MSISVILARSIGYFEESINDIRLSKFLVKYSEKDEQKIIESADDFIFLNINECKIKIKEEDGISKQLI